MWQYYAQHPVRTPLSDADRAVVMQAPYDAGADVRADDTHPFPCGSV